MQQYRDLLPISIHSLRVEGDVQTSCYPPARAHISIHSLRVEGDLIINNGKITYGKFQSTPSGWRETLLSRGKASQTAFISIHSLRVEGDQRAAALDTVGCISIHSLRVEGDDVRRTLLEMQPRFQSTPSGWRETCRKPHLIYTPGRISIHSLRVEGDSNELLSPCSSASFQSTPSGWRETLHAAVKRSAKSISIHSLRVEGDYHSTDID